MPLPTVSVVIPTLNEEALLPATLAAVYAQVDEEVQVLIADGGSTDGTLAIAKEYGAIGVETLRTGRGCQVAEVLRGLQNDVVLVLHADMILAPRSIEKMRRWLADHPSCPGGCLGHRFDTPRTMYRFVEWWDSSRARLGMSYGDQAQFFRRSWLEGVGGFPDQPIMEDVELSRRLRAQGRPIYLNWPVVVSPRRLERLGWCRTVWGNLAMRLTYLLYGPAIGRKLYQRYYRQSDSTFVAIRSPKVLNERND